MDSLANARYFFSTFTIVDMPMKQYAKENQPKESNSLRELRESLLMSKAELARKARVSPITISRIEEGYPCRMDTKRKIILALGLNLSEKHKVFNN